MLQDPCTRDTRIRAEVLLRGSSSHPLPSSGMNPFQVRVALLKNRALAALKLNCWQEARNLQSIPRSCGGVVFSRQALEAAEDVLKTDDQAPIT